MVVRKLEDNFPDAASMLEEARDDILTFANFRKEHRKKIWSNNPLERPKRQIRTWTGDVGIFRNKRAVVGLVGPVLLEQSGEWQVAGRYMSWQSLAKAQLIIIY